MYHTEHAQDSNDLHSQAVLESAASLLLSFLSLKVER